MAAKARSISCGCLTYVVVFGVVGVLMTGSGVLALMGNAVVKDWLDGPPLGNVIIGSVFLVGAVVALWLGRWGAKEQQKWQRIRHEGLEGVAQVEECVAAGGSHNFMPRWTLRLTLMVPGRPPCTSTRTIALPHDVAASLVGRELRVRVDADDPTQWLFAEKLGLLDDPLLS